MAARTRTAQAPLRCSGVSVRGRIPRAQRQIVEGILLVLLGTRPRIQCQVGLLRRYDRSRNRTATERRLRLGTSDMGYERTDCIADFQRSAGTETRSVRRQGFSTENSKKNDNGSRFDSGKTNYKRLAKICHPDTTGGDKMLEEKFKDITEAYRLIMTVLS